MNKYYTIEMIGDAGCFKPVIMKGEDKANDKLMGYLANAYELMDEDPEMPRHSYWIADEFDTLEAAVDYHEGYCYNDTGETYKGGN